DDEAMAPLLTLALDPYAAQEHLLTCLRGGGRVDLRTAVVRSIRVLRYHPLRRCLIEYELELSRGDGAVESCSLIGKMRAKGADRSTHDLLRTLWEGGFGADSDDLISVPQPLGIVPELHMWLQRKVRGVSALQLLCSNDGMLLARRIADAAAKLHRAGIA